MVLINHIVYVGRSSHVLAKVNSAVLEAEVNVSFSFLRTTLWVSEEVKMKFNTIERVDGAQIFRHLKH